MVCPPPVQRASESGRRSRRGLLESVWFLDGRWGQRVAGRGGEAYYLLGVVEWGVGRSFWASETELFLEAAIRMGPKQPYARAAFDLLEEFLVSGYTGSAGTNVPADVEQRGHAGFSG